MSTVGLILTAAVSGLLEGGLVWGMALPQLSLCMEHLGQEGLCSTKHHRPVGVWMEIVGKQRRCWTLLWSGSTGLAPSIGRGLIPLRILRIVCQSLKPPCLSRLFVCFPQSHLQLVKNDPLKQVNISHRFFLWRHTAVTDGVPAGSVLLICQGGVQSWWSWLRSGAQLLFALTTSYPLSIYTRLELGNGSYRLKDWRIFYLLMLKI